MGEGEPGSALHHRQSQHLGLALMVPVERAPELPEHAVFGAEVVVGQRLGQFLDELALSVVQVTGDHHVHDHPEISVPAPAQRGPGGGTRAGTGRPR